MTKAGDLKRKKAERLADKGFACLGEGDYAGALGIAKKLEDLKHTAAFDIAAQAYARLDELPRAIETLERGVKNAPDCWLNWELLGNYRSDTERYEQAELAYQSALTCSNVWTDSVRLNQAILAGRRGEPDRSLILLDSVKDPELSLRVAYARVTALEDMGRLEEALSLADQCLGQGWEAEDSRHILAGIAAARGRIGLLRGWNKDVVRRSAMDAFVRYGSDKCLLSLIRDIDARHCREAKYFRLLIHAANENPEDPDWKGYYTTYDVVAASEDQALAWIREFERPEESQVTLSVESCDTLEERPEDPIGVYRATGRCYYGEE